MTFELKEKSELTDKISNEYVEAEFARFGGELIKLYSRKTGIQYMSEPKPGTWDRISPVLFPIIGCVTDNKIICDGKEYDMYIHGFAHFQNFDLFEKTENSIVYVLKSEGRYRDVYPYEFELYLSYILLDDGIKCGWKIVNKSNCKMFFSIGGHPAFKCPIDDSDRNEYFIKFHGASKLNRSLINMSNGCLYPDKENIDTSLKDKNGEVGLLKFSDDLFDRDALVIEDNQVHQVSLLKADKTPYLSVQFDAPVFGVWTEAGKKSPFVCIEPWYGRCDMMGFKDEFSKRDWQNSLDAGEVFEKSYRIKIFG